MTKYTEIQIESIHPSEITNDHWIEDFNYLYQIMKDSFPFLPVKERILGFSLIGLKDNFLRRL